MTKEIHQSCQKKVKKKNVKSVFTFLILKIVKQWFFYAVVMHASVKSAIINSKGAKNFAQ